MDARAVDHHEYLPSASNHGFTSMLKARNDDAKDNEVRLDSPYFFHIIMSSGQVDSKVLKEFAGMYDAQFLTEIKKERPYFSILAEKATETVDSIFTCAAAKGGETASK